MGDYESWGIDGAFDGEKSEDKTESRSASYDALQELRAADNARGPFTYDEMLGESGTDEPTEISDDLNYSLADAWDEGFAAAVDFRAKRDALPETEIDKPVNPYDKEVVEEHRYATGGPVFDPSSWYGLSPNATGFILKEVDRERKPEPETKAEEETDETPSFSETMAKARDFWRSYGSYGSSSPADYSYHLTADSATADAPAEDPDYTPKQFWDIATEEDQDVASFIIALGKTEHEDTWIKKPDFIQTWDVQKKRKGTAHYVKELDEFIEVRLYDDAEGQTWVQWWN